MVKIILESWREGFEKVLLTKLQVNILGKSLKESKSNVDRLLENKKVIFEIENLGLVQVFLKELDNVGVNYKIILQSK